MHNSLEDKENKKTYDYIKERINKALEKYDNFSHINFHIKSDRIEINGIHKKVPHYYYGDIVILNKDFSNVEDAIGKFIKMWKKHDNESSLRVFKSIIDYGERYGWD